MQTSSASGGTPEPQCDSSMCCAFCAVVQHTCVSARPALHTASYVSRFKPQAINNTVQDISVGGRVSAGASMMAGCCRWMSGDDVSR